MSKFGEHSVRKVAELARLQLTDEEVSKFASQLGGVLDYIEKLSAVDTSGVDPLMSPHELPTPLRPDEARPGPGAETMLASAPEALYDSYKVPQVIGGA